MCAIIEPIEIHKKNEQNMSEKGTWEGSMEKMKMESVDLISQNIEKIGEIFPSCITETVDKDGKRKKVIHFERLRQLLSDDAVDEGEVYEFTWVGKKAAIAEANTPIRKTLRPCPEESVHWDSTENLYIEGDNLAVLKLLQESYLGAVKMIYIDPPYNTGNDFIYKDRFARSEEEYEETIGLYDTDGTRLFHNTDSNGRFHSDWCSMMYSRLLLARNLLSFDGVIFISIDDGEVGNLRKIGDEIFGETNFLANLIWEKKYTVANDAQFFSDNHDHILCYVKDSSRFQIGRLPRTDEMNAAYRNPDHHPKGVWKATPLHAKSGTAESADFSYTFKNGVTFRPPAGTYSRYSAETLKRMDEGDEIWFGKDGKAIPSRKTFLCDLKNQGVVPRTLIPYEVGGHNHEAVEEVKHLLKANVFNNPKPLKLLKYLMTIANLKEDSIVLDFFSGSATTAHALMEFNAERGTYCSYIMVQLPEQCAQGSAAAKAGYQTICEIGKERITAAGKTMDASKVDIGFRVFKLDESNLKDVYYRAGEYSQSLLTRLESNIKEDRTALDLLFGCLLEWGMPLSLSYRCETIDGFQIHSCEEGRLIACFEETIPENVIQEIAERRPLLAVFRDSGFQNSPAKLNAAECFKRLSPDTRIKVF